MPINYALYENNVTADPSDYAASVQIAGSWDLETIADNLLVGDCETIAEKLTEEISRVRPSHMMFHFQVGESDYQKALKTIELFASDIRPMIEKTLGPLANFGAHTPAAAE